MSLTANEVFEIAVQIERNGVTFYAHAARVATDPDCCKLLRELSTMEEDHQRDFEALRDVAKRRVDPDEWDPTAGEMLSYLRAMADNHVFDVGIDPEQILTGTESAEEILSTAIGLEKESVVYYAAIKEVVNDEATRRKIQKIILEEMSHISLLSGQRSALG